MNPLFNMLGGGNMPAPGNIGNLMKQFQQFRQTFQGDPRQTIQQMLNSGKLSQAQYNNAVQMAKQFQQMLSGK